MDAVQINEIVSGESFAEMATDIAGRVGAVIVLVLSLAAGLWVVQAAARAMFRGILELRSGGLDPNDPANYR